MNLTILEERPDSAAAVQLITELETQLISMGYPQESRHGYSVDKLLREGVAFFVIRYEDAPAGCGGIQLFGQEYGEVKRMYVRPDYRGNDLGKLMLDRLVEHARQHHVPLLRLETGIYQAAAIRLYEGYGFQRRTPFGEYREDPLSIFYELRIA